MGIHLSHRVIAPSQERISIFAPRTSPHCNVSLRTTRESFVSMTPFAANNSRQTLAAFAIPPRSLLEDHKDFDLAVDPAGSRSKDRVRRCGAPGFISRRW